MLNRCTLSPSRGFTAEKTEFHCGLNTKGLPRVPEGRMGRIGVAPGAHTRGCDRITAGAWSAQPRGPQLPRCTGTDIDGPSPAPIPCHPVPLWIRGKQRPVESPWSRCVCGRSTSTHTTSVHRRAPQSAVGALCIFQFRFRL